MAITALSIPHDSTTRPACSWRAVFIDSAHTFWPVPHAELLLTIMARYHLNVLHWRLANDTAWRIPIPSFHLLTGAGAQAPRPATDGHATSLRLGGGLAHPPHCAPPHTRARRPHGHIRLHTVRAGAPAPLTTAGGHVNRTITRSRSPHPPHQDHEFRPGLPPPTPPPPRHRRGRMAWISHTTVEAVLPSDRQRTHLPAPHRCLLEDTAGISEGRAPIQTRGPVPPSGARSGAGMEPHPARLL